MDEDSQKTAGKGECVEVNADLVCEECGAFGAIEWDGHRLCPECSTAKGSCCPEFGKDDLWSRHARDQAEAG